MFFLSCFFCTRFYFPASFWTIRGTLTPQVGVVPFSPPVFLPSICIAHKVQQSHYSSLYALLLSSFYSGQCVITGVVASSPRFLCLHFVSRIIRCAAIPILVDIPWSVATKLTHALALSACKSICAQEKVPTNLYEYAHGGGVELTKLTYIYQAQG